MVPFQRDAGSDCVTWAGKLRTTSKRVPSARVLRSTHCRLLLHLGRIREIRLVVRKVPGTVMNSRIENFLCPHNLRWSELINLQYPGEFR